MLHDILDDLDFAHSCYRRSAPAAAAYCAMKVRAQCTVGWPARRKALRWGAGSAMHAGWRMQCRPRSSRWPRGGGMRTQSARAIASHRALMSQPKLRQLPPLRFLHFRAGPGHCGVAAGGQLPAPGLLAGPGPQVRGSGPAGWCCTKANRGLSPCVTHHFHHRHHHHLDHRGRRVIWAVRGTRHVVDLLTDFCSIHPVEHVSGCV